jgi:hypothetical protein
VAAEITKRLPDAAWLELRKRELAQTPRSDPVEQRQTPQASQERKHELERQEEASVHEKIAAVIKELDAGQGADVEQVIEQAGVPDMESIINQMLERGEIYEIKPGLLKVLQ